MKTHRLVAAWLAASALLVSGAFAQATTAILKGKVVDSEGTGLPGVPVTVASKTHGDAKKTVMTDIEGNFKFQLLPPANDYSLNVNYPGFAPIELGPIDLDPGKTTVQDITLRSQEELTQRVEVVAHGSIVDTESTKTASTFNTEFIEGLPIIGHNYQDILTLTPGVTDTDGDGNPNVQGARSTGLQYRLDGGNITDPASGTFGQNLNIDAVEEIEVITSGASAEYGRADGGFANIITKSGSNDFEGSFKMFWQGRFLNGQGATNNVDTFYTFNQVQSDLRRTAPYLTLGGALKKDKIWYFGSIQYLDRVNPLNLSGATIVQATTGHNTFAKVTWQVNSDNKLALQYNDDPYKFTGFFLNFGTDKDSDATFTQGGQTPQLRWTSIISPTLLLETLVTHFESGIGIEPVSNLFHPTNIDTIVSRSNGKVSLQALYPTKECSIGGTVFVQNCDPSVGRLSIYDINLTNGTTTGPYFVQSSDTRKRDAIKTDLSYTVEDAWGEHQIKSGLEFANESYGNAPTTNPFFLSFLDDCPSCRDPQGNPIPNAVTGVQSLFQAQPVVVDQRAVSFNSALYLVDSWKPKQNVTLQLSARIDREDVDSAGFTFFNPRQERRQAINLVNSICSDAARVFTAGGNSNSASVCGKNLNSNFEPNSNLVYTMDAQTPEKLRKYDTDLDGIFNEGSDGSPWRSFYTTFPDRLPENFEIKNTNLSPRLSFSWDPWADGKTKLFSTWGRYYDRLFLDTVRFEIGPDSIAYTFRPDPQTHVLDRNAVSASTSSVTVEQIDRGLKTPYTDAFTVGFERELAPEWSAKVTFTQKLAWNLVQDTDFNHARCTDYQSFFGISPSQVCPLFTNSKGKVVLSDDLFGDPRNGAPNTAPDLYNVNPNFNQILRIGNSNESWYKSVAVELNKRLHRNWQMQASYTYSKAVGNAEDFASALGNDPSTKDHERGFLSYDQRHRAVVILSTHLPKDVELGGTITWEGGTPYAVISQTVDQDNAGNVSFRTFYPTGTRNDQRNGNFWTLDTQVIKRFRIGKVQSSAQFAVQNILNNDDLTLSAYRLSSFNGVQLQGGPQGLRRFGRFWELGVSFNF